MIEAVKSTVASSALLRANVDQSSTLNSYAANPDKIQAVSQPPYVSPTVRVDVNTKMAILEFRESDTGQVIAQIPSEQAIRTYKLREAKEDAQLLSKLTQKVGTQNGSEYVPSTSSSSAKETPVKSATTTSSSSDADVSLAQELNAITSIVPINA